MTTSTKPFDRPSWQRGSRTYFGVFPPSAVLRRPPRRSLNSDPGISTASGTAWSRPRGSKASAGEEFDLLDALTRNPGVTFRRARRARSSAGGELRAGDRSIDVLMARLRRKIEDDPANPHWLLTRAGEGYCFARHLRATEAPGGWRPRRRLSSATAAAASTWPMHCRRHLAAAASRRRMASGKNCWPPPSSDAPACAARPGSAVCRRGRSVRKSARKAATIAAAASAPRSSRSDWSAARTSLSGSGVGAADGWPSSIIAKARGVTGLVNR